MYTMMQCIHWLASGVWDPAVLTRRRIGRSGLQARNVRAPKTQRSTTRAREKHGWPKCSAVIAVAVKHAQLVAAAQVAEWRDFTIQNQGSIKASSDLEDWQIYRKCNERVCMERCSGMVTMVERDWCLFSDFYIIPSAKELTKRRCI